MISRQRFRNESSENCGNNSDNEGDSNDIYRVRRKSRRLVIEDTSDDDQLPEL